MKRLLPVIALLLLAGCSSPADVDRLHAVDQVKYQHDIEFAQEWNTHVLGIPASGWLSVIILSILVLLTLLICAGVWVYKVVERRATNRRAQDRENFLLLQARADRGNCQVCGADPSIATSVRRPEAKK